MIHVGYVGSDKKSQTITKKSYVGPIYFFCNAYLHTRMNHKKTILLLKYDNSKRGHTEHNETIIKAQAPDVFS